MQADCSAARADRLAQRRLRGGHQENDGAVRWLLQRLQKGVRGLRIQRVRGINDQYTPATLEGCNPKHALGASNLTDAQIGTAIGAVIVLLLVADPTRVDQLYVRMLGRVDPAADRACITGCGPRTAIERLGERPRQRPLAHTRGSSEQVGV